MLSPDDLQVADQKAREILLRLSKLPNVLSEAEKASLERNSRLRGVLDPFIAELERLRDPAVQPELTSHRKLAGALVVKGKKLTLRVLRPLLVEASRQQFAFNEQLLAALRAVDSRLGDAEGSRLAALAGALNARLDSIERRLDGIEQAQRRHG